MSGYNAKHQRNIDSQSEPEQDDSGLTEAQIAQSWADREEHLALCRELDREMDA